jgi:hypothetical protein
MSCHRIDEALISLRIFESEPQNIEYRRKESLRFIFFNKTEYLHQMFDPPEADYIAYNLFSTVNFRILQGGRVF